ncbi:MAG: HAD family hydrolase [Pseudomonadota bacterium]
MIEGVLFDLFGTLVDYEVGRGGQDFAGFCATARDLGVDRSNGAILALSDESFALCEATAADSLVEFSMADSLSIFVEQAGLQQNQTAIERLVESYMACWMQSVYPLKGINRLVGRVAKRYRVGLISNTHYPPMVDQLIDAMELTGLFEVVTTSARHGRRKPHPDIFTDTLDTMSLAPENTVYVGDSYSDDYVGSGNAGLSCLLVGRHARVPVDRQLRTIFDLPIDLDKALTR